MTFTLQELRCGGEVVNVALGPLGFGFDAASLSEPCVLPLAQIASRDPGRVVRDAFVPGDLWFVTGDFFQVDTEGDYWFVDRQHQMIATRLGPVASTRIEDALYEAPGIALCMATGRRDPADPTHQLPIAAIQLHASAPLDLDALSRAVATLPENARPRRLRIVDELAMNDGFQPIKRQLEHLELGDGPDVLAWNTLTQRYERTAHSAARSTSSA